MSTHYRPSSAEHSVVAEEELAGPEAAASIVAAAVVEAVAVGERERELDEAEMVVGLPG